MGNYRRPYTFRWHAAEKGLELRAIAGGVSVVHDGFPFKPAGSGWAILAIANARVGAGVDRLLCVAVLSTVKPGGGGHAAFTTDRSPDGWRCRPLHTYSAGAQRPGLRDRFRQLAGCISVISVSGVKGGPAVCPHGVAEKIGGLIGAFISAALGGIKFKEFRPHHWVISMATPLRCIAKSAFGDAYEHGYSQAPCCPFADHMRAE